MLLELSRIVAVLEQAKGQVSSLFARLLRSSLQSQKTELNREGQITPIVQDGLNV
jgi:hypothetical protein